ncbi:hypothetical protein AB0D11_40135 [Streptomyces monashensis]|uniref:hypothetical protein n=1 Tax=Streptomyces monashensis TaxID=1678012 RepID=UPI0033D8F8E2
MTDDKTPVAEAVEEKLVDEVIERLMDRADASGAALQHHSALVASLKEIYTASTEQAAPQALEDFAAGELGQRYPAIVRLWGVGFILPVPSRCCGLVA